MFRNEEEVKSLQRSSNQTDEFGAIAAGIVDSVKQDPKMLHTDFITFLKEHTGEKDTVVAVSPYYRVCILVFLFFSLGPAFIVIFIINRLKPLSS